MNKAQNDLFKMFEASYGKLTGNNTVYAGNVPFEDAVDLLGDNIKAIRELNGIQTEDVTGITDDKKNRRRQLEKLTYDTSVIIIFYASVTDNSGLRIRAGFTRTDLRKAKDNALSGISQQVHQAAADNAAALAPYGLTGAMINDLEDAIGEFSNYMDKPQAARSDIKEATKELPKLFKSTNELLDERLDKGMELYRESHNDFYRQYFISRKVIKSPAQKRALHAKFIDSKTRKPLAGVSIVIDDKLKKLSWKKGTTAIQNLYEGSHVMKASLPRYQNIIVNFNVITGETTRLVIEMVKEG